jgi:hypothetical protein
MGHEGVPFEGGPVRTRFRVRAVVVAPGRPRVYDATEWQGALVVVRRGTVELETRAGACWRFREGDILWLEDLPLKTLRSPGPADTLLIAVSRRCR